MSEHALCLTQACASCCHGEEVVGEVCFVPDTGELHVGICMCV